MNSFSTVIDSFSFKLGGAFWLDKAPKIERRESGNITVTVYEFSGGLKLTNTVTEYPEYSACEWMNFWENEGDAPTDIISEIWDADVALPLPLSEKKETGAAYLPEDGNVIKIYSPHGSDSSALEFVSDADSLQRSRYSQNRLTVGQVRKYATVGGRCAQGPVAPFFNIKHGRLDTGYIVAVGWTGQWNAEIERKEDSVIFRSGIENTNFKLLPGESFRTSSVTVMKYDCDLAESQNRWRRFVKEIYSPIGKGGVPDEAPFCAGLWGGMSSDGCIERIKKVENFGLPFDHYWMDAGWYGDGVEPSPDEYEGDWYSHTGNWEINKTRHPDNMEKVVAELGKSSKRFILWFEPERVRRNVPILRAHPEYFIDIGENDILLNLGKKEALDYCIETISELIERLGVDVYRQDFNFCPLKWWRSQDSEDRQGITEIKHINGLYNFWDTILARFPGLMIDNCASGGRRIDIETLRRSVPLWRSDAQCPANPIPEVTQANALGFGAWMPYSGTGVGRIWMDTYRFRSAYAPAMTTNFTYSERNSFGDDPDAMEWLSKMCREYLRVRPYLSKDMYPLTDIDASLYTWNAAQYHDTVSNSGVILVYKRENSPYTSAAFKLRGLMPNCSYVIEDADGGEISCCAESLMLDGLKLNIDGGRVAKVYFYKKNNG